MLILWLAPSVLLAALTSWQEALVLTKKITSYYIVWFSTETVSTPLTIGLFFLGFGIHALIAYRYVQLILTIPPICL